MKKVLIYFAMAVVLALGSTSCSDFLEIVIITLFLNMWMPVV